MREILFRGKRKDNGEWIEGDLVHRHGEHCITNDDLKFLVAIQHETGGQFTGLTDNEGKRIFEGDKVFLDKESATIKFLDGSFYACIDDSERKIAAYFWSNMIEKNMFEIVGNIHDNPELLK